MQVKLLTADERRVFAVVLGAGDEVTQCLLQFARDSKIGAGHFTGIGAFHEVTLGYFDYENKSYDRIPLNDQVEILSLAGNFATSDGEPKMHAHVVVGKRDGRAFGGHLLEGRVRPTLELVVEDEPAHLRRRIDPATGLPLINL
jgi:predicted DNA-binding protein with PD1-like motif